MVNTNKKGQKMRKEEISEVLNLAYKTYMQDGKIPPKVNVGAFLIKAAEWDLNLKINLYYAKREQVEKVAKEMFNFTTNE